MGVEFLPICDVLFNVVSLASYFCDVVFDIIATYTFFVSGHTPWFWISLISIASSLITCQILSAKWMMKQERYRNMNRKKFIILTTFHALGGGIIWRYSLLFAPIQLDHVKQEMRNLCVLRMIHGFAESMTLLLIQTYIACISRDSVQEINVISMALSLFNVCWALASFTKNIRQHNVHRLVLTWIGVIFQFMWRLGTITSRVLVLVLYSTVYKSYVFLVIILHWITMMLWVLSRYAAFNKTKVEKISKLQEIGLSLFVSYIHIFCYVNLEEQSTKLKIITFYAIMLVENILLMALWTLGEQVPTAVVGWDRDKIYIAVSCSFLFGLFFMVIYYKYFHVRKIAAALSSDDEDVDKNNHGHKLPQYTNTNTSHSSMDDPAVTVFNCALNPALRKKKKMPSRSVPPAPAAVPFWKEPLQVPVEERTAGDGFSYSRTTSVDDIRQKLQEKKEKQMMDLRRMIEDDIATGRIESQRPQMEIDFSHPIPGTKKQPMMFDHEIPHRETDWRQDSRLYQDQRGHPRNGSGYQNLSPELSFTSDPDHSGRYRSYKDSSGDQGDVDSGDDYYNERFQYRQPGHSAHYPGQYQYMSGPGHGHAHGHPARDRVVIGGDAGDCYSHHQTPL